jgi:hypothetical protein
MQAAAGVAGHQQGAGGVGHKGGDGGVGDEEHLGGAIGVGRVPEPEGVVIGARDEASVVQDRQGTHRILKPLEDAFAGSGKPSQGHEKVRQKPFHVMIGKSLIFLVDHPSRQRNLVDVRTAGFMMATHSSYALES